MHNKNLEMLLIVCLCFFLGYTDDITLKPWESAGPAGYNVISVLYAAKTKKLLAGTDKGLLVKGNAGWVKVGSVKDTIPVWDMIELPDSSIVAVIGKGATSDGVYWGKAKDSIPYYELFLIDYLRFAQTVAAVKTADTIYVGARNTIARSVRSTNGSFGMFEKLKAPADVFGSDVPYCAEMHYCYSYPKIYGGGYDRSTTQPSPGHLVYIDKDSAVIVSAFDVTSITEDYSMYEINKSNFLYAATKDSGIYFQSVSISNQWKQIPAPSADPLVQICGFEGLFITASDKPGQEDKTILFALVNKAPNGNMYYYISKFWRQAPPIQAQPVLNCMSMYFKQNPFIDLYVGTSNGIYASEINGQVSVAQKPDFTSNESNRIAVKRDLSGSLCVTYTSRSSGAVSIVLLDCKGRIATAPLKFFCKEGIQQFSVHPQGIGYADGMYLIRITAGSTVIQSRVAVIK